MKISDNQRIFLISIMLKNTNNYFGDSDNHRPVDHVSFCLLAMRLRKRHGQFHLVVNEFLNKH